MEVTEENIEVDFVSLLFRPSNEAGSLKITLPKHLRLNQA
jgi:hypothetical protein